MLFGSTSVNDNEMVPFPGLYELFTLSADPTSDEVSKEIFRHLTQIVMSMVDVGDYTRRAIFDPDLQSQ